MPTVIGITTRDPTQIYRTIYIENECVTIHRLNTRETQKESTETSIRDKGNGDGTKFYNL